MPKSLTSMLIFKDFYRPKGVESFGCMKIDTPYESFSCLCCSKSYLHSSTFDKETSYISLDSSHPWSAVYWLSQIINLIMILKMILCSSSPVIRAPSFVSLGRYFFFLSHVTVLDGRSVYVRPGRNKVTELYPSYSLRFLISIQPIFSVESATSHAYLIT